MKKGDICTIIGLNGFGMCNRAELKYYGSYQGVEAYTANEKGARKKYRMPDLTNQANDRLTYLGVFPLKIQGEITRGSIRTMHGDCLIRIYGTPLEVEALVRANLNQNFTRYDAVFAMDEATDALTPVFPEVPTNSHPVEAARKTTTV